MTISIIAQRRNEFYKKASPEIGGAFIITISNMAKLKEIVKFFNCIFCLLYGKKEQRPEFKRGICRKARYQKDYALYSQVADRFG